MFTQSIWYGNLGLSLGLEGRLIVLSWITFVKFHVAVPSEARRRKIVIKHLWPLLPWDLILYLSKSSPLLAENKVRREGVTELH